MVTASNVEFKHLKKWADGLKLELNPGETKTAFFTTNRRNFKYKPNVKLNNNTLNNEVYLGVLLDTKLRLGKHKQY